MSVAFRHAVRRWPPYGCLLGSFAGVILVTAAWPTVALAREWLWIAGVVVGAAVGVVIQLLVHEFLLVWRRPRLASRALTVGAGQRRGDRRAITKPRSR
jgi:hypothetical protein